MDTPFRSKVTVPVRTPPAEVTVAVNVTACRYSDGFTEAVNFVVVADLLITSLRVAEALVLSVVLPTYTALMACVLAIRDDVS